MLSDFAFGGLTQISFFAMQFHTAKIWPVLGRIFCLDGKTRAPAILQKQLSKRHAGWCVGASRVDGIAGVVLCTLEACFKPCKGVQKI
jgi:hypothetical protein